MLIERSVLINAPVSLCFDLTRSIEFHEESSKAISAKAIGGKVAGLSEPRDVTKWRARFFGVSFSIKTEIGEFEEVSHYTESMKQGLPKKFQHAYEFKKRERGCLVSDRFEFCSRFGLIGRLIDRMFLQRKMELLVESRLDAIRQAAETGLWKDFVKYER